MLTLDKAKHEYRFDGRQISSVTDVIKDLQDTRWFTDWGRERGRIIHRITELDDRGILDEATVDDRLVGYLNAWRKFKKDTKVALSNVILDIKSGDWDWTSGLQLAGYEILASEYAGYFIAIEEPMYSKMYDFAGTSDRISTNGSSGYRRLVVGLSDNGDYRMEEFTDRRDREIFLAQLAVHNYALNKKGR